MTNAANSTKIGIMIDEDRLIQRLLGGDKSAVREFYVTYSPRLLRFIRRKIGNEQDVEEIAQDTLFAFLEGIRDFTQRCSLNTYLCSIAAHKIVDFYRKRKVQKVLFSQLPQGLERLISDLVDPEVQFDQFMLTQKIQSVLTKLTPRYRHLLSLKYVEGRSVVEIAGVLTMSFKSTESALFRARKEFIKLYMASGG